MNPYPSVWTSWIAGLVLAMPGAGLGATGAEVGDATGIFESRGRIVEIVDAYAFRGASARGGEPVWVVAVSNARLIDEQVDRYVDRRYVIDHYFRDADRAVIFFELADDGTFRGLSYDLGAGNGCAHCRDQGVQAHVDISGERIAGTVRFQGEDRGFDVELDVALSTRDHGDPLPADGGDPGKAYRAFHQAARTRDAVSLRLAFSRAVNATWSEAEELGQGDSFLESWLADHMTEIESLRGWSRGGAAVLLVEGRRGARQILAEVLLVREAGTWRVDDELVRISQ